MAIATTPAPDGVLDRVATAMARHNRLGFFLGIVLGGWVPIATYVIAHYEAGDFYHLKLALVAGGLAYSAFTVFDWANVAFRHWIKALGFVILLEGVMTVSSTHYLGLGALAILVTVNAIGTAYNLIINRKAKPRPKRKTKRAAPARLKLAPTSRAAASMGPVAVEARAR